MRQGAPAPGARGEHYLEGIIYDDRAPWFVLAAATVLAVHPVIKCIRQLN
jgi:hypothetical protein